MRAHEVLTKGVVDVIYAASVLAANSVLRSLFGAAFPLFTTQMYDNLGNHWASSVPAFLAVACMPFPLMFYRYGERIRHKCKFAAEAAAIHEKMHAEVAARPPTPDADTGEEDGQSEKSDHDGSVREGSVLRGESS